MKRKTKSRQPKSIVLAAYKAEHKLDAFAKALSAAAHNGDGEVDLNLLQKIATENGFEYHWGRLNPGQQRMAVGNVLRGKLRRGEPVTIAGKTFKHGGRS